MLRPSLEEVARMRGEAVQGLAALELQIDGILCAYYGRDDSPREAVLMFDVLADELFSFGLRCNVLEKLLRREGWLDKHGKKGLERVREVGRLRNLFAHMGKPQVSTGKLSFFHPKGTGMIFPRILYDDFKKAHEEASLFVERTREMLITKFPDRKHLTRIF
jgi:hypothetical protein